MKIRRCKDCNKYRYIKKKGLCPKCCNNNLYRRSEFNLSYDPSKIVASTLPNKAILGKIGSGKTVGNMVEMLKILGNSNNTKIYAVDLLGEYSNFTKTIGGEEVKIDKKDSFNIFNLKSISKSSDFDKKVKQIHDFILYSYSIVGFSIGSKEEDMLRIAIEKTYQNAGINRNGGNINNTPEFNSLLSILQKIYQNPNLIPNLPDKEVKNITISIHNKLDVIGNKLGLKNTIRKEYVENYFTYFNLEKLDTNYSGLKQHMIFNEVWEYARSTDDKIFLYMDNAIYMFSSQSIIDSLIQSFKYANCNDLSICLSMCGGEDVFMRGKSKNILQYIGSVRLHHQDGNNLWLKKSFDLSNDEIKYIKNANTGTRGSSSQALMVENNGKNTKEEISVQESLLDDIS